MTMDSAQESPRCTLSFVKAPSGLPQHKLAGGGEGAATTAAPTSPYEYGDALGDHHSGSGGDRDDDDSSSSSSSASSAPTALPLVLADLGRCIVEFGPRSPQVAETWNALGLVRCRMQGDPTAAIKCHSEALNILKAAAADGGDGARVVLQTVVTLSDLGSCYELLQDHDAALLAYRQAEALIADAQPGAIASHIAFSCQRALARIQRR